MKLSTRARYGVRLMLSLSLNYGKGPILLKDISKKEEISEKYLSLIIIPLRRAGLVNSNRGAYGGYTLAREPSKINVKEIVDVLEGGCLVNCINDSSACSRISTCAARDIWVLLGGKISETLQSITLEKFARMSREKTENTLTHQI
jgi:Rrf2 family protein